MVYIKMYSALLSVVLLTSPALRDAGRDWDTPATKVTPIESAIYVKTRVNVAKVTMENKTLAEGNWGGQQVRMFVTESGAEVDFACAHGTVDQRIELDSEGRFDARGTYEEEGGGPVKKVPITDEDKTTHSDATGDNAARYTGRVTAQRMTLTVTLTKTGRAIGTFSLIQGATPRMHKCN
jgi:hypothetical protein